MQEQCYLCKSDKFSVLAGSSNMRFECFGYPKKILKCKKCGLVQLLPQWTDEELCHLYSFYSQRKDFKGHVKKSRIDSWIKKYLKKSDNVLEVGCGEGRTLKYLMRCGYDVLGIDKDSSVCDGALIQNCDFKNFKITCKFDFIYALHVFEHLMKPKQFLKWLMKALKSKGRFVFELPNGDDPLMKLYKIEEFEKFYWYPYHIFFYSKDTLEKLFLTKEKLKVKVKLIQHYGILNHLHWIVFRKPSNIDCHIPIVDSIYKFILTKCFKVSDTLLLEGERL